MKTENKCVYCLCNECHIKSYDRKRKRETNDSDMCDHMNLGVFADSSYFTSQYLQQCQDNNLNTPTKCSECRKMLSDKNN